MPRKKSDKTSRYSIVRIAGSPEGEQRISFPRFSTETAWIDEVIIDTGEQENPKQKDEDDAA